MTDNFGGLSGSPLSRLQKRLEFHRGVEAKTEASKKSICHLGPGQAEKVRQGVLR